MLQLQRNCCCLCGRILRKEQKISLTASSLEKISFRELAHAKMVRLMSNFTKKKTFGKSKKAGAAESRGEIVFGIHPVQLALTAKRRKFYRLFLKDTSDPVGTESYINAAMLAEGLVEKTWVSKYTLDKLSEGRPHQGICLDASPLLPVPLNSNSLSRSNSNNYPIWLLPYRIRDPQNLGAILRSSYFLGVDHVVIPTIHTCPLTPVVSKASSGAMEVMRISHVTSDEDVLQFIKGWRLSGGKVLGTSLDKNLNPMPVNQYKIQHPTLLIVGNEEKGIDLSISSACDHHVFIESGEHIHPMMDSLNVSVATGILLYHLCTNNKT